jgi:hypothetical protein
MNTPQTGQFPEMIDFGFGDALAKKGYLRPLPGVE